MMMLRILVALLLAVLSTSAFAKVGAGTLVDLGVVQSKFADARHVTVWLPSSYSPKGPRHAVLYMHDGQNLFDPETGYGGMEWKIDETLDRAIMRSQYRRSRARGNIAGTTQGASLTRRLREQTRERSFLRLPAASEILLAGR